MTNRSGPVRPATIRLTNALGFDVTVEVDSMSEINDVVRTLARSGWRSGTIPVGGIVMPLRMFPVFDFSLIGCDTPFVFGTGDEEKLMLRHNGQIYKHRWAKAVNTAKMKMPSRLWFSRGANASDEEFTGGDRQAAVTYIPLISFGGKSRVNPEYAVPGSMAQDGEILKIINRLPGSDGDAFTAELESLERDRQDLIRSRNAERAPALTR